MWKRLLRSRPVHMALVSGISVYVLLTIFGMILHESEHTSAGSRHIASHSDNRGVLNVRENDENRVRVISSEAGGNKPNVLVAAPAEEGNFIFGGPNPVQAHESPDKLDQIAKLLKNVEAKMKDGDDENPDVRHDIRDIKNAINDMLVKKGDVIVTPEAKEQVKGSLLLEEPKNAESPGKVSIDELPYLQDPQEVPSLCPKTVQTLAKYSKWFHDRYQHSIKLFTDFEDVRSWNNFHKLDHYTMPFGFRRTKRQQLAAVLNSPNFTNTHLFKDTERPQCLRCAVVGCGGILNGSNAGPEIDSHDLVFRLNRALSSGRFGDDVGKKTSFYTFFPESQHATDVTDENAMYVYTMFKQYDIDYMENIVKGLPPPLYTQKGKQFKLKKPPITPDRLKLLHPDFSRYVFTHFLDGKSHRPTTGALVVMMAVHICDEVTIYGFGYDKRFTLHYYDKAFVNHTDKSTALHDVDNERGLWNKLHEEGVIRFFKRDL